MAEPRPKVVYFTACTLDGFIADADNSLQWLFDSAKDDVDDGGWDDFIAEIGPMAMGATTYQWILEHEDLIGSPEKWQQWYADRPAWVFTHRELPPIPGVDLRFASGDVRPVYDEMVAARDGNVWLVGGGDLVGQFDDAGLLDEIQLGMRPVTLGAGAPLLPRRILSSRLSFREVRHTGQSVQLVLDVKQPT